MSIFKQYIETTVSQDPLLSQTSEFVTYYALPYVPNPLDHKSFKHLFTPQFQAQLKRRVGEYLETNMPTANHKRSIHSMDSHNKNNDSLKNVQLVSKLEILYRESRDTNSSQSASIENQKLRRVVEDMQTKIVEAYEK